MLLLFNNKHFIYEYISFEAILSVSYIKNINC